MEQNPADRRELKEARAVELEEQNPVERELNRARVAELEELTQVVRVEEPEA